MNHRIELTKKFLWEKLMVTGYFKDHQADGEYRYEHSIRVANIGKFYNKLLEQIKNSSID